VAIPLLTDLYFRAYDTGDGGKPARRRARRTEEECMVSAAIPEICPRCNVPNQQLSLFCNSCRLYLRDETMTVERCTYTRRFFGNSLLEGVLFLVTLIIGWFIWLIFTSKDGQTPAKKLVGTYAIGIETGRQLSQGETWLREVVIKLIALGIAGNVTFGPVSLLDDIWLFFDKDRQTLHDKVLKQVVVYAPAGLPPSMQFQQNAPLRYTAPPIMPGQQAAPPQPPVKDVAEDLRELARLKEEGVITEEEYERKRADLVNKM